MLILKAGDSYDKIIEIINEPNSFEDVVVSTYDCDTADWNCPNDV